MRGGEEIACPLCRQANSDFEAINRKINEAKTPTEKAPFAEELIMKVQEVLKGHETSGNVLTDACRTILHTRKQVAELILKFKR